MPDNPRGVSGLAALLKYVVELKAYKIDVGLIDKNDTSAKLSGLAGVLQQNFANKMQEVADIKELLYTAREQKRVLLNNLMQEMQFKVNLRRIKKEKSVEDLLSEQT